MLYPFVVIALYTVKESITKKIDKLDRGMYRGNLKYKFICF